MISIKYILVCIMILRLCDASAQVNLLNGKLLDDHPRDYWFQKVDMSQIILDGLDSVYFNRIYSFSEYENMYPDDAYNKKIFTIHTSYNEKKDCQYIKLNNSHVIYIETATAPICYFEHRGYTMLLFDDGLKRFCKPLKESKLFTFKDFFINDDTPTTMIEFVERKVRFRMASYGYDSKNCRDDNTSRILVGDFHADYPGGRAGILKYLKQNVDLGGYELGLFFNIIINEDGHVSPYRMEIPTCATADQWDEMTKALIKMHKWKPYIGEDRQPKRTMESFHFSKAELDDTTLLIDVQVNK